MGTSRSRRGDENNSRQQHYGQRTPKKGLPTTDHPLKLSPIEDKPSPTKPIVPLPISSFKLKPIEKANFWTLHSGTNISNRASASFYDDLADELINDSSNTMNNRGATSLYVSKESKLIEFNLANNQFTKIPECLSCLTPKLVKLNLSSNRIESMGAVCDLPTSLKFLDLSNNKIKRSMRLLNENLLKFIFFYFSKLATTNDQTDDNIFNLNNILVNLLLGNLTIKYSK